MMPKVSKKSQKSGSPTVKKVLKSVKSKMKVTRENRKLPFIHEAERGVVYVKHLPHGFYEAQIQKYFKQFGNVTAYNLPRNKRGRIKGYVFIEFEHPEVAKIAAETMNNYLMFDRLLKAKYIPPEEQKPNKFYDAMKSNRKTLQDLANMQRKKDKKSKHKHLSKEEEVEFVKKQKAKIRSHHEKLSKYGIEYDFQVANEPVQLMKVNTLPEDEEKLVVEVDESEDEISFKTPPNAIKKLIRKRELTPESKRLLRDNKRNEKEEKEKKKGKTKENRRSLKTTNGSVDSENAVVKKVKKSPSISKKSLDNTEVVLQEKPQKIKTKVSDKSSGILKKFKKSEVSENKERKSNMLGVKRNKGKPAKAESDKLKKKLKGLNLAGVKQMMSTFF